MNDTAANGRKKDQVIPGQQSFFRRAGQSAIYKRHKERENEKEKKKKKKILFIFFFSLREYPL